MTRRRWVTAYAVRVGTFVNLFTLAGFGIGNLIWIAIDEDSVLSPQGQNTGGAIVFATIFGTIIAALVAMMVAHALASIRPLARQATSLKRSFEAAAVLIVVVPVFIGLSLEPGVALAFPSALFLGWVIVKIAQAVGNDLPPYPGYPTASNKAVRAD